MAAATTEKKSARPDAMELYSLLADGEKLLSEVLALVPESAVAAALGRHEAELGQTKYVVAGNPDRPNLTHNGVSQAKPTVIIEGGIDWPLPNARITRYAPLAQVAAEKLPVCPAYQRYCLEVCVAKDKDVWEWVEKPTDIKGRETRWARRDIDRAEAEGLFGVYVRLTDKGLAAL